MKFDTSIVVGSKSYKLSKIAHKAFVCQTDAMRKREAESIIYQLKEAEKKVNLDIVVLSLEPERYKEQIKASTFDEKIIDSLKDKMEENFYLLEENLAPNYLEFNEKDNPVKIPLTVVLLDGLDSVSQKKEYKSFSSKLNYLTARCRAAGIHCIALLNNLPDIEDKAFEMFGVPTSLKETDFSMKNATNTILKSLYKLDLEPSLHLQYKKAKNTIGIKIKAIINDAPLLFEYDYDQREVNYSLRFPCNKILSLDEYMELYRTLRSEGEGLFPDLCASNEDGEIQLSGSKEGEEITEMFVEALAKEVASHGIIEAIKKIANKSQ